MMEEGGETRPASKRARETRATHLTRSLAQAALSLILVVGPLSLSLSPLLPGFPSGSGGGWVPGEGGGQGVLGPGE
ncbi:hypothetical protein Pmani_019056 [Petrolisthes manimaculis]|uniref:Uncharacterized protein n=1 Tax=Petrolisthes manimaculis TaxID=1843537 RepID=A0AAE1U3W1_9EUCA|nr:hypothetical protein Pmani_019056 [Petrolisthes manimaculis]